MLYHNLLNASDSLLSPHYKKFREAIHRMSVSGKNHEFSFYTHPMNKNYEYTLVSLMNRRAAQRLPHQPRNIARRITPPIK